ncbi:MAG TPA: hypothetical protein DEV74_07640 [Acidovorax sp.]|nr:hypothetical protein [Acidovorax sp.]
MHTRGCTPSHRAAVDGPSAQPYTPALPGCPPTPWQSHPPTAPAASAPRLTNIRHNKQLTRLNHRGRKKVNTQWNLYCMMHNIEKLARAGCGQQARHKG